MLLENAHGIGSSAAPGSGNFSGTWVNQLNSQASFTVSGSSLSGTFTSSEGSGPSYSGPISGYINGNLIAFCVNWSTTGISAWVGEMISVNGADTITTLWQMTTSLPDDDQSSGAIFAGSDTFTRQG